MNFILIKIHLPKVSSWYIQEIDNDFYCKAYSCIGKLHCSGGRRRDRQLVVRHNYHHECDWRKEGVLTPIKDQMDSGIYSKLTNNFS
jgi:hypothetical protein